MNQAGLGPRHVLRLVTHGWRLHLKIIAMSAFEGALQVVWPLFFATSAFLLYRLTDDGDTMVYAGIGASMMGIWSAIASTASGVLQRERWFGTLELLVSTPTPFPLTMIPITLAIATLGLYSMVATLLWGWLVFDVQLHVADVPGFVVSVLLSVVSMAMIGFLLSVTVVRYRTAWALGNLLEYPGWLLCGFFVPLSVFPDWVSPISYALPPTWGVRAVREAAVGTSPWAALAACVALSLCYGGAATLLSSTVLRSARKHATLSLT
ncbi:ABC transporter permease [Streptomyces sp. NPDC058459]|uniref:ABC transporter permease n=1 Tax=Streptomyces sp. NPDC058459 TaxID=3346508 RepID=UPI00365A639B